MRTVNSILSQTHQFSILHESQLGQLHHAVLEVLRRTGIRFHHQGALETLNTAGAFISEGNLVKFPASLVEASI
jgi:trimethylamine:corrinoid methyltransferase-like protein